MDDPEINPDRFTAEDVRNAFEGRTIGVLPVGEWLSVDMKPNEAVACLYRYVIEKAERLRPEVRQIISGKNPEPFIKAVRDIFTSVVPGRETRKDPLDADETVFRLNERTLNTGRLIGKGPPEHFRRNVEKVCEVNFDLALTVAPRYQHRGKEAVAVLSFTLCVGKCESEFLLHTPYFFVQIFTDLTVARRASKECILTIGELRGESRAAAVLALLRTPRGGLR